jgi:hypothetical protein
MDFFKYREGWIALSIDVLPEAFSIKIDMFQKDEVHGRRRRLYDMGITEGGARRWGRGSQKL